LFDQVPNKGEIPNAEGVSCVWQRTLSSVRGSVGFLVPQKVYGRVPLIVAASRGDICASLYSSTTIPYNPLYGGERDRGFMHAKSMHVPSLV